ncbi:uncharacterized protein F5147DRAFT_669621 [Suillus discolor]|uniref:Ion transport domain-containing protein n=1 Tax=Suillus discolor TaxID=1912936 RepID=A0A9P7FIV3_9AGAM|nr:uncharacterized protein F5147DRAFT_669621 [Suillus discolor]KAG2118058.1 hypothetical protein F5147DRAFT_669621 [Suillus discolor]
MPDVYESAESDALNDTSNGAAQPVPTRSIYALTRKEITRGIANRFVHSHTYIFLYLSMAALSVTTVVLSLSDGCPGLSFYILEIIINTSMILEVGVRFVAFGRQFWRSPFNVLDLILTLFCAITLLVITFAGCGAGSKEEELLDTLLLIARNVLQFGRLAAVMRQSGQSIFSRPKPIDISAIRRAGYSSLDYDLEDDDQDDDPELGRPLVQDAVLFDAQDDEQLTRTSDMPRAAQAVHERDDEDVWAELG